MFGPVSPFPPLEVLSGSERQGAHAVADEEEGDLRSGEELLEQHRPAVQPVHGVRPRRRPVGRDQHALAGGEPVSLHHVGGAGRLERRVQVVDRPHIDGGPGRHARLRHHPLREGLAALQPSGGTIGPEHRDSALPQRVGDPRDQGCFRADHDQVDRAVESEFGDRPAVGHLDGSEGRDGGDAGVARRDDQVVTCALGDEGQRQRVFPGAGADDQDAHRANLSAARTSVAGMVRARISDDDGDVAVIAALAGDDTRTVTAVAVRYLLQRLADRWPGNSVEVRVPPFGAVQCIEGPRHTRGTPPNVVEMPSQVWIELATGRRTWTDAQRAADVQASGSRADLSGQLPIWRARVLG